MSVMGMAEQTQMDILSVVAAILHMGNISFVEQNNAATIADNACKSRDNISVISDVKSYIVIIIQMIIHCILYIYYSAMDTTSTKWT